MIFTFSNSGPRLVWALLSLLLIGAAEASSPSAREALRTVIDGYEAHAAAESRMAAADAFFLFEESALDREVALRDPTLYRRIEAEWAEVISAMGRGEPRETVVHRGAGVIRLLEQADQATAAGGSLFLDSLLIILREGFEAILVVSALAAYLGRVGQAARLPVLYGGAGLAVAASLALWVAARTVIEVSGVAREALEGWTMLLAAVVLFWVSYWLISRAEAQRWQAFVRAKVERALGRGALFGLGFLSFVVVFREGFETVLFYEALAGRAGSAAGHSLLVAGFLVGVAALAVLYGLFLRFGPRVPLRPFFAVTGGLLYLMAFKFAGAGVFELQVAQVLSQTPVAFLPDALVLREWLGIYPYAEPAALQGLLLVLALVAAWTTVVRRGSSEAPSVEPVTARRAASGR